MVIKEEAKEKEKDVVIVIEIVKCEHNDDSRKKWPKATFFIAQNMHLKTFLDFFSKDLLKNHKRKLKKM